MKVSKEQRETLKSLTEHRGFKLLETIIKDFEIIVLQRLKTIDLANEKDVAILQKNQYYLKGVEDLLATIKGKTNTIGSRKFD